MARAGRVGVFLVRKCVSGLPLFGPKVASCHQLLSSASSQSRKGLWQVLVWDLIKVRSVNVIHLRRLCKCHVWTLILVSRHVTHLLLLHALVNTCSRWVGWSPILGFPLGFQLKDDRADMGGDWHWVSWLTLSWCVA